MEECCLIEENLLSLKASRESLREIRAWIESLDEELCKKDFIQNSENKRAVLLNNLLLNWNSQAPTQLDVKILWKNKIQIIFAWENFKHWKASQLFKARSVFWKQFSWFLR